MSNLFNRIVKESQPIILVLLQIIRLLSKLLIYNKPFMTTIAKKQGLVDIWLRLVILTKSKVLNHKVPNKVLELCLFLRILYKKDRIKLQLKTKVLNFP